MRYSNRISKIHTAGLSENVSDFLEIITEILIHWFNILQLEGKQRS